MPTMFRKRWFQLAGLMAILLAAGLVHFTIWSLRPGITGFNFARLEVGMTQTEVEELLGTPGFAPDIHGQWVGLMLMCTPGGGRSRLTWADEHAAVLVIFDTDGRLQEKSWQDAEDSLMARLKRWLPGKW